MAKRRSRRFGSSAQAHRDNADSYMTQAERELKSASAAVYKESCGLAFADLESATAYFAISMENTDNTGLRKAGISERESRVSRSLDATRAAFKRVCLVNRK